MPQPYLASSDCRRNAGPGVIRMSSQFKRCADLAWCVMAVDPDSVMVMPAPMSRNPNPVSAANIVAWPMDIGKAGHLLRYSQRQHLPWAPLLLALPEVFQFSVSYP